MLDSMGFALDALVVVGFFVLSTLVSTFFTKLSMFFTNVIVF